MPDRQPFDSALACGVSEASLAESATWCRSSSLSCGKDAASIELSPVGQQIDGFAEVLVTAARQLDEVRACLSCAETNCSGKYFAIQACAEGAELMQAMAEKMRFNATHLLDHLLADPKKRAVGS